MTVEQIENTLLRLPRDERRRFANWFYEHENEILDPRDDDEVHPEVKAEILRRLEEVNAQPELLEPWAGTLERARARPNEFRRQKAESR